MLRIITFPRMVFNRLWVYHGQATSDLLFPATVSIWLRWAFLIGGLVESSYRVEVGSLSHILNSIYMLGLMIPNAFVQWRIRKTGRVDMRWLLALSAVDAAAIAFTVAMSGGFESRYFGMYFALVVVFAWVFSPWLLVLSWTTMLAVIYVVICFSVGDGIDFGQQQEKELFYRLLALYPLAISVNLITRFERRRRFAAVERERELNRQRIEMSQTVHDTTAQSAYTLGLGLEEAIEMADENPQLVNKLEAMWELTRSAMWTLRNQIDGGPIFSGSKLGDVLDDHIDTFTAITSIPATFVRHGEEPPLPAITRSLLFSIAHNALTNALRHSGAESVNVTLDFAPDGLRMSVIDNGSGLPDDYAGRGYGFRNMKADAERIGGKLEVESGSHGTIVSCTAPYDENLEAP